MTRRFWVLAVVVVLVGAGFAVRRGATESSGATSVPSVPSIPTPALTWAGCTGKDAPKAPFECATVKAPLNYRQPADGSISLALVRLPAASSKRGIILSNPGGPGASGFDFIAAQGESMVSTLGLDNYDLVGFDPRGVDRSGGVKCQTDAEIDKFLYVDSTPDTVDEKTLYDEALTAFGKACTTKYGDTLAFYSTEFIARDMDLIRRAMKADTLNYIGISYGTYLGGVYATLFPDTTGRMLLDGAFDPAGDTVEQQYTTQAEGFEKAFANWSKDCESEPTCEFRADDVGARWDALLESLDKSPLTTDNGRTVNNAVMETATTQAMYAKSLWSVLSSALAAAEKGNGAALLSLADSYNDRRDDGTFSTLMQSFPVIGCASGFGSPAPKNPDALVEKLKKIAPRRAKSYSAEDFSKRECDGLMPDPPVIEISYSGDAPIVVVGGKNDPATPFRWSEEMAANLGANARLVTYTGEGHSQLLVSKCVDAITKKMFSSGATLPAKGTVCDPDPVVARPTWWSTIPAPGAGITAIPRDRVDGYVGVTDTQAYTTHWAVPGGRSAAFVTVKKALMGAGFTPAEPSATDTAGKAQYFEIDGEYLGVFAVDAADIANDGFVAPNGPVPRGASLVVMFFFPPDK